MKDTLERVIADPRYAKNVEYGKPRPGHPEGQVKAHIVELESNLERLKPRLTEEDYWKLKLLIHTHDTFKAEASRNVPILDPHSHASLAKSFAAEFIEDADLLNMIQYHDEGYALWRQVEHNGSYSEPRFQNLLDAIDNWNLFLLFIIVDGCTAGKDRSSTSWFINAVNEHRQTFVDESWML